MTNIVKTPHVHAELIKQWADGAEIQWFSGGIWETTKHPGWAEQHLYRIKPEPKPDVIRYRFMCLDQSTYPTKCRTPNDNIMFVFDGETGELKDVQLLAKE